VLVAALSSEGRLLVFAAAELPELPRGKGNKIFGISSRKFKTGEETLTGVAVLEPGQSLLLVSNQRTMTLGPKDLAEYRGARSQRGGLLPRGWRKIDRVAVAASGS
jgi:topoisomerase-4 subunit A